MKTLFLAVVVIAAALAAGGAMVQSASESRADDLPLPANLRAGEKVYNETCIACHGPDGKGAIPGATDFTKPAGVLATKSDKVLLAHIMNGFQEPGAPLTMPPKGGNEALTLKDLNDALAYLHQHFHYKKY